MAERQSKPLSPPLENDKETLIDYSAIIQDNFQQLLQIAHRHKILTAAPATNEGNVSDVFLVNLADVTYLYAKFPSPLNWQRVQLNDSTGIPYGEISASDVMTTLTITATGQGNKVQVTAFDTNGLSNNMTPDHTNDHLIGLKAGVYFCSVSMAVESGTGAGFQAGFSIYKNNGTTEFPNLHAHRNFAGGGSDRGSITLSGFLSISVNDTIELWTWNDTNTVNIIIDDVTMSLMRWKAA